MADRSRSKIMVVDDARTNIDILVETLGDDYEVRVAMDGASALQDIAENPPDLILLDIIMPGMDGYEVCRRLKADEKTRDISIIFITAMNEIEDETKGFELGAVDFIAKPFRPPVVISRVQSVLALKEKTGQLAMLSSELSKYLSPQVYQSIFCGDIRAAIESQRKKLTVFFSDIVGFTEITERMEPEDISSLLNAYLNAMSSIAIKYGGTVDKFVGDAVMVFFGDPATRGEKEDALACVRMALEMMNTLKNLQKDWYDKGVATPFNIRVGINTGYCAVGNFGSSSKMDYTIIGSQVNIAKRLEEVAREGQIVVSHETWSHIKDKIHCIKMRPVNVKGIADPVMTYQVVDAGDQVKREESVLTIGILIEEALKVAPETLVKDIPMGRRMDDNFDGMVVTRGDEPIGIIMNYHLNRMLASYTHREMFFEQPLIAVMDAAPLILERDTPLEKAARLILAREKKKIYDIIVVAKNTRLVGIVPVYSVLEKIMAITSANN